MKRSRLESFVEENRHEFDLFEPADHVWDSIEQKLDQKEKKKSY